MKTYISAAVFVMFILPIIAFSQVEIGPDEIPSEPGVVFSYYTVSDSDGIEVEIGQAGEDREWDFSLLFFENVESDTIIDPDDAPDAEEFPDANLVIRTSDAIIDFISSEAFQYQLIADTAWYMIGIAAAPSEDGPQINIPLNFSENPMLLAPLPLQYESAWDIELNFSYGMESQDEWGEELALLDSVLIEMNIDGSAEVDAWGTAIYTGGEVEVLRQYLNMEGTVEVIGVMYIGGFRIPIPLYEFELEATHSYRWISPDVGIIATMTSLPLEENRNFDLASSVRVLYITPELVVLDPRLDFGFVPSDDVGVADLVIWNVGEGGGLITRVDMSEELAGEVRTLDDLPVRIDPDGESSIRFLWTPGEKSDLEGVNLELFHNDPALDNPIVIALTGSTPQGVEGDPFTPYAFKLDQNYPNPFNRSTSIRFTLPTPGNIKLSIYDMSGKWVKGLTDRSYTAGIHEIILESDDLTAGVYLYRFESDDHLITKKMVYLP